MKTAQEIFDTVARHLLTQKRQARGSKGCAYRGYDNTKCAVGCLIPDNVYCNWLEGQGIHMLISRAVSLNETDDISKFLISLKEHASLLQSLQNVHDTMYVKNWKVTLSDIASYYSLNDNVLKEFP